MTLADCEFCHVPDAEVIARNGPCFAIWTHENPLGSAMVMPFAHRVAPWELNSEEWAATQVLLQQLVVRIDEEHTPSGCNVGWNVGTVGGQTVAHAHCHLIPRYEGEKYAGRGLRWLLKHPDNVRSSA
jgi:histidine triad (HIT) family protein